MKQLQKIDSVEPIDLSSIDPSYSNAPPCDVVEDDNLDEEFPAEWIELGEEIDVAANIGVHILPVVEEEEEHVHMEQQDPFPTPIVDIRGKGLETSPSPFTPSGSRTYSHGGRYKRGKGR